MSELVRFGSFLFVLVNLTQTRVCLGRKKQPTHLKKKMIPLDWHAGKFVGAFSRCERAQPWAGGPEIYNNIFIVIIIYYKIYNNIRKKTAEVGEVAQQIKNTGYSSREPGFGS